MNFIQYRKNTTSDVIMHNDFSKSFMDLNSQNITHKLKWLVSYHGVSTYEHSFSLFLYSIFYNLLFSFFLFYICHGISDVIEIIMHYDVICCVICILNNVELVEKELV